MYTRPTSSAIFRPHPRAALVRRQRRSVGMRSLLATLAAHTLAAAGEPALPTKQVQPYSAKELNVGPSSWYFRPGRPASTRASGSNRGRSTSSTSGSAAGAAGAPTVAAPIPGSGSSYATAWTSVAEIKWASIAPGDTLYVCGLHDGGRADGALNLTNSQGSGRPDTPVTIDGACVNSEGQPDPGTLMSATPVPQSSLGTPDANGIYTYSYVTPPQTAPPAVRPGVDAYFISNRRFLQGFHQKDR